MERLTRDQLLMEHAQVAAKRGTCSRLQVGAVFSREGRIISTGYNGVPRKQPHCDHRCNCLPSFDGGHSTNCNRNIPCIRAQHAERNAIDFAARHGLSLEGTELHVTHGPCEQCAGSLLNVGVVRVVYSVMYRLPHGVEMLEAARIKVVALSNPVR